MRLSKRIKQGIQSLTLWVGKAEEVPKLHREEADKNTILHREESRQEYNTSLARLSIGS